MAMENLQLIVDIDQDEKDSELKITVINYLTINQSTVCNRGLITIK